MRAQEGGLIGAKPTAAIDATGMESRHTSRYFFKRAGRKHNSRLWTKLAVACDTASHFFTAATVSLGPANDAPQFRPLMAQASLAVGYDRVLGDAAFDGEESHRYCREDLGVRSTVIPINRRNGGRKWPKTRYRRQMVKRFRKKPRGSRHKRVYGQRLAGGERLLPTQAAARLGAAGQVGCVARTRVLPAGTHPQPHAPRRYRLEDFNRARNDVKGYARYLRGSLLCLFAHMEAVVNEICDNGGIPTIKSQTLCDRVSHVANEARKKKTVEVPSLAFRLEKNVRDMVAHPGIKKTFECAGTPGGVREDDGATYERLDFQALERFEAQVSPWLDAVCAAFAVTRLEDTDAALMEFTKELAKLAGGEWKANVMPEGGPDLTR